MVALAYSQSLFEHLKSSLADAGKGSKGDLGRQMEEHVKRVMMDVSLKTKDPMHPLIKYAHHIKAKFALIEPPFVRAIELAKNKDRKVGEVLEEVHDMHTGLFKQLLDIAFEMEPKNSNKMQANFRERSLKAFQEAGQGASNTAAVEKLFKENQEIIKNWEEDRHGWNVEKTSLQKEISILAEENQRYLDMILKNTKRKRSFSAGKADDIVEHAPQGSRILHPSKPISDSEMRDIQMGPNIGETGVRVLTLKQLTEVIADIYESKLKCDQKYIESKLPRETMEQHMYTFLNTKYGLKSLIIEWATAIVNGIKQYNGADNTVAVFGKILRNECDEEFRFVQHQLKTTIEELLKMLIRSKYPYKNKAELQDLLTAKIGGYLSEEDVNEIVKYMYSKDDSAVILASVRAQLTRGAHLANE
jgi:hypothetical protein